MGIVLATEPQQSVSLQPLGICVLGDDREFATSLQTQVQELGLDAFSASDSSDALEQIGAGRCRIVLCDLNSEEDDGLAFVEQALHRDPGVFVILIAGSHSAESAVQAVRAGAYDYLTKPIEETRLRKTLSGLAEQFHRRQRIHKLDEQLLSDLEFHGIVGRSPAMLEVFDMVERMAPHYTNVLLTGASGTGKELLANAIHQLSPVSSQRFAACNCAAIVDTVLESQLFGHVRGSFTGASDTRSGLFEDANGGTVFLDEIGETAGAVQAKLLRLIQSCEIQRMGSTEVRRVDVRLIAATSRDLRAEASAGRFREDLLCRLSTFQIRVPSLSERLEDIPLLVAFFLKKYNEAYRKEIRWLTHRAKALMMQYDWPGNVRELESVIAGAALLATHDFIDSHDLPARVQRSSDDRGGDMTWRPLPLEDVRNRHIKKVLEACGGNRVRAAQLLGIGRTSLYRYLKRENRSARSIVVPAPL